MKRITTKSVLRPATAALLTAGLIGGTGALAGTAMAATTPSGGGSVGPAATAPATPRTGPTSKTTHHTTGRLTCQPIGFTVLHNDRIGSLALPAGHYRVWSPQMSCKTASGDFTMLLNHYRGVVPGWNVKQYGRGYGVFTLTRNGDSFAAQYVG